MFCTSKWVKKSLLRWSLRLGRWTATTVQKTTLKLKKKIHWQHFFSNRSQHIIEAGCLSKLGKIVSGVPQGSFLIVDPVHLVCLFSILKNELIGYSSDPILIAVLLLLLLKKVDWREWLTPYQSEDPSPTTPTHRMKEEKGKTAGDKKWASG